MSQDSRSERIVSDDYFNIGLAIRLLLRGWLRIVGGAVLGAAVLGGVSFLMRPVYRADMVVVPASDSSGSGALSSLQSQFGGLASLAGINLGASGGDTKTLALATLMSRSLIEEFIKEKDLLPVLFPDIWNPETKTLNVDNSSKVPTMDDAYRLFDEEIRIVSEDTLTGLITLSIEWYDRELAAAWATELIGRTNARLRGRAVSEARKSIAYLEKELQSTNVLEVQQGIYTLIQSQVSRITLANVSEEYAFSVVDPPVVSDPDNYVRPMRVVMAVLGFLLGGFIAAMWLVFGTGLSPRQDANPVR